MSLKSAKGTIDYYPSQWSILKQLSSKMSKVARRYHFKEIDTPVFETLETLTLKSGQEIKEQIFVLEKRSKNEELGLRFDMTIPSTRLFVQKQKELSKPVKWSYFAKNFRYERPQKGRDREFFQFGCEMFGSSNPLSDAELIRLTIDCLLSTGLEKKDFFIRLNNRRLLTALLNEVFNESDIVNVIRLIDKKDKITKDQFESELFQIGEYEQPLRIKQLQHVNASIITSSFKTLKPKSDDAKQAYKELQDVLQYLDDVKDMIEVDLSIARGFDYYTGIVFEAFDSQKEFRSLAGGGRYDSLVEQFGGQACPAAGFAIGLSTLQLLLNHKNRAPIPDEGVDYFVMGFDEKGQQHVLDIATKLRQKYMVEVDLLGKDTSKNLKYATSIGAKMMIIVGENELKSGKLTVKDLTTKQTRQVPLDSLLNSA